jgi:hypothetical protein
MDAETSPASARPGRSANLRSRFHKAQDRPPASVFVVGTLFSGSTLIGRDLTTRVRKAHYVGELNNFTQFPGFSHRESGRACGPCSLLGRQCRHFTDALRERVTYDDILGMHEQLAQSLDASAIIDGSKYVAWLRHALDRRSGDPGHRARVSVLVTVRNRCGGRPASGGTPMSTPSGPPTRTGSRAWSSGTRTTWRTRAARWSA